MSRITAFFMACGLWAMSLSSFGQSSGRINMATTVPVFNALASDLALAKRGGVNADYAGHALLAGTGFTAELWFGPLGSQECELIAVAGARTVFQTGAGAGFLVALNNVVIPGTGAGQRVQMQLRVWENRNGSVTSWAQAVAGASIRHGSSALFVSDPLGGLTGPVPNLSPMGRFNIHEADKFFRPPSISRQPASRTECQGATAMFLVTASGEPPLAFQWFRNNQPIGGGTNASLFVPAGPNDNGAAFFVEVSNSVCSVRSSTATLTVDSTFNFFSSFENGLPGGTTTNLGNAGLGRGFGVANGMGLNLVGADNNLVGWFSVPPFFTAPVHQAEVSFKSIIAFNGVTPTEGFSVNLSPTRPAGPPFPSGHDGQTDGLTVSFDTAPDVGGPSPVSPSIDIKYKGQDVARRAVTFVLNRYADVSVRLSPFGEVSVSYDGQLMHNAVPVPGFVPFRSFFNFGAATGSSNFARVTIDDLCITAQSNSLPVIIPPANVSIPEDSNTGRLGFIVRDAETAATDLIVTARSSNTALIPNANLELFGTETNRFVQATPLANAFGVSVITLDVTDRQGDKASATFTVTVNAVNDRPFISSIDDQVMDEDGVLGPIEFQVFDIETVATGLSIGFFSSNTTLVPISAITLGGTGTNRTLTIRPTQDLSGTSLITVVVSDPGIESSRSEQFLLTVRPINDPPSIKALPDITIAEDTSTSPIAFTVNDVDSPVSGVTLSASSSNLVLAPLSRIVFGGAGSTRTVQVTPTTNAVGTSLITVIATDGGGASSQQSFLLTVTNVNDAPTISAIADVITPEDTPAGPINFTIADIDNAVATLSLTVFASSNTTLLPLNRIVLGGAAGSRTVTVTPETNQHGTSLVTLRVSDGAASAFESFLVTVQPVNDPPVISLIADQSIPEDSTNGPVAFTIGDAETAAAALSISATSSNVVLVPLSAVTFGGSGANRTFTIRPVAGLSGTSLITVRVSDGTNVASEPFLLTVRAINDPPVISAIADQVILEDGTNGPLAFTVSDAETIASALTVSVESTNKSLLPNANIILAGTGANRTVTAFPALNQSGTTLITLTVSDGTLSSSEPFLLTVRAVNDPPVISEVGDTNVLQDEILGPVPFQIGDVETPATALLVSGGSTNSLLFPPGSISLSGSGSNRFVTVTPGLGQSGVGFITLEVEDAGEARAQTTFIVVVRPRLCVDSTEGTNFWVTFPGNYEPDPLNPKQVSVAITGQSRTRVRVEVASLGFSHTGLIPAAGVLRVPLPSESELSNANDLIGNQGVQVTADGLVNVTAFHEQGFSQDAFGVFPVDVLGQSHLVMAYGSLGASGITPTGSQIALVAASDATTVRIVPSAPAGGRPAGIPFSLVLQRGQTYQLRCDQPGAFDLTGTSIEADKPVAVYAGHQCASVPRPEFFFCNYLVEPVHPIGSAGSEFVVAPFLTRRADSIRILGTQNSTRVFSNGVAMTSLNRGQVFEMTAGTPTRITTTQPVHVSQLAHSSDSDGLDQADPTLVTLAPSGRWMDDHLVFVPTNGMTSFLNIVARGGNTQVILRVDGNIVPLGNLSIAGFSMARIPISPGAHRIQATAPIQVVVYGFGFWDAYGFNAGMKADNTRGPDVTVPSSLVAVALARCTAPVPLVDASFSDDCTGTRFLSRVQIPAAGTLLGVGTHQILTRVADSTGNTSTVATVFSVRDPGGVTIQCPSNIVVSSSNAAGAVVLFTALAASPCNPSIPVISDPPSGSVFPPGVTRVTTRIADPNLGSNTCSFTVTVNVSVQPPEIIDPVLRDGELVFGVRTQPGVDYVLEKKVTLDAPWELAQAFKGDGNPFIFRLKLQPNLRGEFFRYRRLP